MAKLYPPYLEGTIPAFYGNSITVPFAMNRAVSKNDINGFQILIKTIQTGKQIESVSSFTYNIEEGIVKFTLSEKYEVGQSYKMQIAYRDITDNSVGYYSTVAIVKYTERPEIFIANLLEQNDNVQQYEYTGCYETYDISEKLYSSKFKIYDNNKNLIRETDDIIHNSLNDEGPELIDFGSYKKWRYVATERYSWMEDLEPGNSYFIQFTGTTVGLMSVESPMYPIVQDEPIPLNNNISVIPFLNYDNGYININLQSDKSLRGQYVLLRSDNKNNFRSWQEMFKFTLGDVKSKQVWKDFTTEHGVSYQYAVAMIDTNNYYSTRSVSGIVQSDFEDMFLFDGERQLKIRFNPKVSSFKNTIVESKTDTIGGKYPYFFRNGHISYKEFPVSGLLTHLTDNDGYFEFALAEKKYEDKFTISGQGLYSTNLSSENISMEKTYKLEALKWLTNGKPKLFRSPTEGNYIVRLMNVSLSPLDNLGRMLHSFNSTAYEIMEYNHKNLVNTGIIKDSLLIGLDIDKFLLKQTIENIDINDFKNSKFMLNNNIHIINKITFNITQGQFYLYINDQSLHFSIPEQLNSINIPINNYILVQTSGSTPIQGTCDIEYETALIPAINEGITRVNTINVPAIQFYGLSDMYNSSFEPANLLDRFLITPITLTRFQNKEEKEYISKLFQIKAKRRNVIAVREYIPGNWSTFLQKTSSSIVNEQKNTLYEVYSNDGNTVLGYRENGKNILFDNLSEEEKNLTTRFYLICDKILNQGSDWYEVKLSQDLILNSNDIDFNQYEKIRGNIFLDIEFCCRLGSKEYSSSNIVIDETVYLKALDDFQNNNYYNQSSLENCLNKIQNYWKEGRM